MKNLSKAILAIFMSTVFLFPSYIQAANKEPAFAPDFKLQDMAGNTCTLSNYRGKQPVLLFFWTSWCPFCRRELAVLSDKYAQLAREGWEVLAVNVGEVYPKVESAIKTYHLSYRVLLDQDTNVAASYGILGVPTYVFIDKAGYVIFKDNYFPPEDIQNSNP